MISIFNQQTATIIEFGKENPELTEANLCKVSQQIIGSIKSAELPAFVYDLSHSTIISSYFIHLLIKTWKLAKARGGNIVLVGLKADGLDELKRLRIDSLWKRYESRDEAVDSYKKKKRRKK